MAGVRTFYGLLRFRSGAQIFAFMYNIFILFNETRPGNIDPMISRSQTTKTARGQFPVCALAVLLVNLERAKVVHREKLQPYIDSAA